MKELERAESRFSKMSQICISEEDILFLEWRRDR